ncbi:hypothetical protein, partial [Heyndrickxia coagulans]|uniref:hypothetical protein n=1 Tax=Heyndrickxia coagulans TaxID=1398 RepID=UPI002E22CEDD|nr:hypothetical protein [Heyndrickxia coagulans]
IEIKETKSHTSFISILFVLVRYYEMLKNCFLTCLLQRDSIRWPKAAQMEPTTSPLITGKSRTPKYPKNPKKGNARRGQS